MSEASDIRAALDPLLATFSEPLTTEMTGELADIYMSGHAEMMTWGKTAAGIPIAFEGPPVQAAIDWAQKHCATLVTRMDEETKTRLAQTISDGIANKRGPGGLATDIKRELGWMGRGKPSAIKGLTQQGRAFMIARTETASALSQASLDAMNEMGIEGKEWVTAGDDAVSEECQGNEAEGVIPVNQSFSGGVMAPPQHPNCRCVIAPARMKGAKPAEEPAKQAPSPKAAPPSIKVPRTPKAQPRPAVNLDVSVPAPDFALPMPPKAMTQPKASVRAWQSSLKGDAQFGVDRWTASSYDVMKKAQVAGKGSEPVMKALKGLDEALKTAPGYNAPVYRGMTRLSEATVKKMANSKTLTMKSHTSFSASSSTAFDFARSGAFGQSRIDSVLMTVRKNISGRLISADELEVLVQKGTQYSVVDREVVEVLGRKVLRLTLEEV